MGCLSVSGCTRSDDSPQDNETATEDPESTPPPTLEDDNGASTDSYAGPAELDIYYSVDTPTDATVIAVHAESVTDDIKEALALAESRLDNPDRFDESDHLTPESRLVERTVQPSAFEEAAETLDRDREHGTFRWYVLYSETEFVVELRPPPEQ